MWHSSSSVHMPYLSFGKSTLVPLIYSLHFLYKLACIGMLGEGASTCLISLLVMFIAVLVALMPVWLGCFVPFPGFKEEEKQWSQVWRIWMDNSSCWHRCVGWICKISNAYITPTTTSKINQTKWEWPSFRNFETVNEHSRKTWSFIITWFFVFTFSNVFSV